MISITAILLLVSFQQLYFFFAEIQKTTEKISHGDLTTPIVKENKQKKSFFYEEDIILQNLETMRLSLLESQNQTSRFIMGISHDIRTPISIIKGYTEALSDGIISSPKEIKNALDIISKKTEQLEGITESIIDFTRMDSKELREQFNPINLYDLLFYFAKSTILTLSLFKRNFIYEISIPENTKTKANKNLVLRALDNLFSNAVRYSHDNDTIKLLAFMDSEGIKIKIEDTGIGIEKKELDFIFNLFYRGTNTANENGLGVGLGVGLAVVHNITELHGWKISCESEKNKGSCFTITIPLENCSSI
ncbi:MAG: HAMP domain-containing histidine kinase [Treponema sp.]|nr:HAMP domain-containing histidine kinase [Treponema sp.]